MMLAIIFSLLLLVSVSLFTFGEKLHYRGAGPFLLSLIIPFQTILTGNYYLAVVEFISVFTFAVLYIVMASGLKNKKHITNNRFKIPIALLISCSFLWLLSQLELLLDDFRGMDSTISSSYYSFLFEKEMLLSFSVLGLLGICSVAVIILLNNHVPRHGNAGGEK